MNDSINPDNVNPHFEHPEAFGLKPQETHHVDFTPHFDTVPYPVQRPCPSCGHCPTCGRGSGPIYYQSPWYSGTPGIVLCGTATAGAPVTVKAGL